MAMLLFCVYLDLVNDSSADPTQGNERNVID